MRIKTSNLGRHKPVVTFRRNLELVLNPPRGIVGFQEIDEADTPDEHGIIAQLFGARYRFVGWDTHVPIAIPNRRFKVIREKVYKPPRGGQAVPGPAGRRGGAQSTGGAARCRPSW